MNVLARPPTPSREADDVAPCRTTVLLGAGASVDAGVPCGPKLDGLIRSAIEGNWSVEELDAWDYLDRLVGGRGFEEIYRHARELAHAARSGVVEPGTASAKHATGAELLAGTEWDANREENSGHLPSIVCNLVRVDLTSADLSYLDPLADLVQRQGHLTVSTLNYDGVIEHWAAARHHTLLQDDDPAAWQPGRPWHPPTSGFLQLLKLHGSADWEWRSILHSAGVRALGLPFVKRSSGTHSTDPAVILGAGNKLRPGGPFLALLEAFASALAAADHLVVVGYSFSDVHVNARIAEWFDGDPNQRSITVVSPSWPTHGSDDYSTHFASVLDHRLRLSSSPGLQVGSHVMAVPSDEPRLRVISLGTKEGFASALRCPELTSHNPKTTGQMHVPGRQLQR